MSDEKEQARLRALASHHAAVDQATDAVHAITGRTDQSVADIVKLHPDHPAVAAYRDAVAKRDELSKSNAA